MLMQTPTIHIEVIPHSQQRYPTMGDYWVDAEGVLQVRISQAGGAEWEFPVLIHELVEWWLSVARHGVAVLKDIDRFDLAYEVERDQGQHSPNDEPGDDPRSPYWREHRFAENIERQLVHERGQLTWQSYEENLP